jgi:hypothetical protein
MQEGGNKGSKNVRIWKKSKQNPLVKKCPYLGKLFSLYKEKLLIFPIGRHFFLNMDIVKIEAMGVH